MYIRWEVYQPLQSFNSITSTTHINSLPSSTMHIPTLAASLLAAAGFAAAAPASKRDICPVTQQGDYVWKLSNFYARKPDGITINSIGFNIKATNNGTLDFDCGAQADSIVDDKFYPCGEYSFISFAWQGDRSGVLLKQDVGDE